MVVSWKNKDVATEYTKKTLVLIVNKMAMTNHASR